MGRPTLYTSETAEELCSRLAEGKSIRLICEAEDMPSARTVYRWLAAHSDFRQQYARAREVGVEVLVDEILEIADDSKGDTIVLEDGREATDSERVARSKLRVDARKWLLAKLAPKKYGEKLDVAATVSTVGEVRYVAHMPPRNRPRT